MSFLSSVAQFLFSTQPEPVSFLNRVEANENLFQQGCPNVPNLNLIIAKAYQSIGTVILNGTTMGCGLLVGVDRLLVPLHLLSNCCPSDLTVSFMIDDQSICSFRSFSVLQFHEPDEELDYCILQLSSANGVYPGNLITIPLISSPHSQDFFLIHQQDNQGLSHSFGTHCEGYSGKDFCSNNNTFPGSSGGINFDIYGNPFAMHIGRSTGLCGRNDGERTAVFLTEIANKSPILSSIGICKPLCPPIETPSCLSIIENTDPCLNIERHGVFESQAITVEDIPNYDVLYYERIVEYLAGIKTQNEKEDFYSKIWGGLGTGIELWYRSNKERSGDVRIDRQSGIVGFANLQIQIKKKTVATLIISKEFGCYPKGSFRIAELVNYVTYKFIGLANHAKTKQKAMVFKITAKTDRN